MRLTKMQACLVNVSRKRGKKQVAGETDQSMPLRKSISFKFNNLWPHYILILIFSLTQHTICRNLFQDTFYKISHHLTFKKRFCFFLFQWRIDVVAHPIENMNWLAWMVIYIKIDIFWQFFIENNMEIENEQQ